jgi:pimeloyl-ACP methyl ester carboxylesterase
VSLRFLTGASGWRRRVLALLVGAAVLLLTAGWTTGPAGGNPPAPRGSLYQPPRPLPEKPAGTLIWAEKVPLPLNPPATVWRILYHSRNLAGRDIAVSGFAVVPLSRAGGAGRPVYAWAHGSVGQGDRCAPSHDIPGSLPPYGGELVASGVALVATDYEGLGTPGTPTPYVGVSEGHAVLDSVRAVAQLPNVGKLGSVVIAGHSQGGGAALWAAQLAHRYAAGLDVRGVVALAPAAEFTTIVAAFGRAPFSSYLGEALWAADGLQAAYGARADLVHVLTDQARANLPRVEQECADQTLARWKGRPESAVFARNPLTVRPFVSLLNEISPGRIDPNMPILLLQGSGDQEIPPDVTNQLHRRYCQLGATVSRHVFARVDHDAIIDVAQAEALAWIAARFRGRPAPHDC